LNRATASVLLGIIMIVAQARGQSDQRALLPVRVNETARGDILALVEGDDVFVPKTFLDPFRLPLEHATSKSVEGEVVISLRSLAPNLTFKIDPVDLVLAITVDPRFLGRETLSVQRQANVALDRGGDPSLFFNYAVNGQKFDTPAVFTEFGASRANHFFYNGLSRSTTGQILRGLTYVNIDSPHNLRRWTGGDAFVGSDVLGGTLDIAGVTLSRQFSLQPYLIRSPALDLTGAATTPSTVEVYVNGQLTNRIQVAPGVFTLHDLPATGGVGDTRLVIRDAFGRETVQDTSFYYSTSILRKGFSDYVFSAGAIRNDFGRNFAFDGAGTLAQYRRGVTDRLTLGGRFEGGEHIVSGGSRATFATPIGDFDAGVGVSRDHDLSGHAESYSYRFNAPRLSFGLSAVNRSDDYATLSMHAANDRTIRDWNAFFASNLGLLSLGVVGSRNDTRSGVRFERLALQANAPIGRFGNVFASAGTVEQNNKREPEYRLGVTIALSHSTTADVLVQRSEGQDGVRAEIRKPLTLANGYGYTLQNDTISDVRLVSLQYQSSFGRYEIDADPRNSDLTSYSIAGGLVSIGRRVIASRAVQDSYALARVGVPGVRIFAGNQEVGRTTGGGDLLIPNLLPHYLNVLRIDDKDIPIDYEVAETEVTVVPPSRGGVIGRFPIRRLHSYTGTVRFMIIGEPFVPSLGQIEVRNGDQPLTLSLGRNGEFYVEDLTPGSYPARLLIGKVHCDFRLTIPTAEASTTDLGVISCAP
jgi:outer membrane usher protein